MCVCFLQSMVKQQYDEVMEVRKNRGHILVSFLLLLLCREIEVQKEMRKLLQCDLQCFAKEGGLKSANVRCLIASVSFPSSQSGFRYIMYVFSPVCCLRLIFKVYSSISQIASQYESVPVPIIYLPVDPPTHLAKSTLITLCQYRGAV